jgi:hypothetical protein
VVMLSLEQVCRVERKTLSMDFHHIDQSSDLASSTWC